MKLFILISAFCVGLGSIAGAQTQSKNYLLLNPSGNTITLGAPATVTNYSLLLPGTLGPKGALLFIESIGGNQGTSTWLNPGSDGQALVLSSGVPAWATITNGTVTAFSFTDANGIAGVVTNATATPNLILSLGAITPVSVNGLTFASQASGFTISGGAATAALTVPLNASVSGTNTGDQTITLTGDVTGSGTGSFAATISDNAVTYAKMQPVSTTSLLLGSSSATTPVQEISLGAGLSMSGSTLSATGSGGTVSSVGLSMPSGFSVSGSPVISSGTLAVTTSLNGVIHGNGSGFVATDVNLSNEVVNILGTANGGTGINTSSTSLGSILYTSGTGSWATRSAGTSGYVLVISGSGVPDWVDPATLVSIAPAWDLLGNSITGAYDGATGNFLGTTNTQSLVIATTNTATPQPIQFWTNNTERMRLNPTGFLGLNQPNPSQLLEVRDGNLLLSNSGTPSQLQMQGTDGGTTNFQAGAQGATNITYTLPTAQAANAGQTLINNGAGALSWGEPTYKVGFGGSRDNFEDFVFDAYAGSGSNDNQYAFTQGSTGTGADANVDGTAALYTGGNDYFGLNVFSTGTTATGHAYIGSGNFVNKLKLGGREVVFEMRARVEALSTPTQRFMLCGGLQDDNSVGQTNNGVWFCYSDNESGGQWQLKARSGGGATTVLASGIAVAANQWYVLKLDVSADGSTAGFYVDDVFIGSITTGIPTTNPVRMEMGIEKNIGTTNRTWSCDWVLLRMVR